MLPCGALSFGLRNLSVQRIRLDVFYGKAVELLDVQEGAAEPSMPSLRGVCSDARDFACAQDIVVAENWFSED